MGGHSGKFSLVCIKYRYIANQLLFTSEKFLRGSREHRRREYFLPQTSPCRMAVKTTQVFIRLTWKISRDKPVCVSKSQNNVVTN